MMPQGACFVCKHSGQHVCNAEEAEIKCMVCGRCEAEKQLAKEEHEEQIPTT